jgi:hypothetical protein
MAAQLEEWSKSAVLALIWFLNAGNMLAEEIHCQLLKL